MKKSLLSICFAAAALSLNAEVTTVFTEDFEWLEPWALATDKTTGSTVEEDNPDAYCPQIVTPKVDGVSALAAMEAKGYEFLRVTNKAPGECIYLQKNYLKFGKTGFQAGLVFPAFESVPEGGLVTMEFDWCPQRKGDGGIDPVHLLIVVKNGEVEKEFEVPTHGWENGHKLEWIHATVALNDVAITPASKVTLRQTEWPKSTANRWFLDNVKFTHNSEAGVEGIEADNNAPVEYFNLQGIRVANPENGLFIRRQGNSVSKVLVK